MGWDEGDYLDYVLRSEYDNGTKTANFTVDFKHRPKQKVTLGANVDVTLSPPIGVAHVQLKIVQDATGSRIITWSTAINWTAGVTPILTIAANAVDCINLYYDNSEWYGQASCDFK